MKVLQKELSGKPADQLESLVGSGQSVNRSAKFGSEFQAHLAPAGLIGFMEKRRQQARARMGPGFKQRSIIQQKRCDVVETGEDILIDETIVRNRGIAVIYRGWSGR